MIKKSIPSIAFILLAITLLLQTSLFGQAPSAQISTANIENKETKKLDLKSLFDQLDLNLAGMETVKSAWTKGDEPAAIQALLAYFQSNAAGKKFRPINWSELKDGNAEDMLNDVYNMQGIKDKMPRRADGYLNRNYIPKGADIQFGALLSRMNHLNVFLYRFHKTGDQKYLDFIYNNTIDFNLGNPAPTNAGTAAELKAQLFNGNQVWLTLNSALRLRYYIKLFYTLVQIEPRNDAGLLILLNSIAENANYIQTYGGLDTSNWSSTEMTSLLQAAIAFPELKASSAWTNTARTRFPNILKGGFYPDGAQVELATGYGYLAMVDCIEFYRLLKEAGITELSEFTESIQKQILFYAWVMNPEGSLYTHGHTDNKRGELRKSLLTLAREFDVPEALYICTEGREGIAPKDPSSRFFNWSGFFISRDGYTKSNQWSAFNAGPLGIGHLVPDQLAFQVYNERPILIAPGRFTYAGGNWHRDYFGSIRGQNTISLDGFDQYIPNWKQDTQLPEMERNKKFNLKSYAPLGENEKAIIEPKSDFFRGRTYKSYRKGEYGEQIKGDAVHERAIYYQRGKFWVVVDRINSTQNRKVEAFWHFHPDCKQVEITDEGATVTRDANQGNLLILPIEGNILLQPELFKGQEKPFIQGWYSDVMNNKIPSYDAVYKIDDAPKQAHFGWLLVPFHGDKAPIASATLEMRGNKAIVKVVIDKESTKCEVPFGEVPALINQ